MQLDNYIVERLSDESRLLKEKFNDLKTNGGMQAFNNIIAELEKLVKAEFDATKYTHIRNYNKFIQNLIKLIEEIIDHMFEILKYLNNNLFLNERRISYFNKNIETDLKEIGIYLDEHKDHVSNMNVIILEYKDKLKTVKEIFMNFGIDIKIVHIELNIVGFLINVYEFINKSEKINIEQLKNELISILSSIEDKTDNYLIQLKADLKRLSIKLNLGITSEDLLKGEIPEKELEKFNYIDFNTQIKIHIKKVIITAIELYAFYHPLKQ